MKKFYFILHLPNYSSTPQTTASVFLLQRPSRTTSPAAQPTATSEALFPRSHAWCDPCCF